MCFGEPRHTAWGSQASALPTQVIEDTFTLFAAVNTPFASIDTHLAAGCRIDDGYMHLRWVHDIGCCRAINVLLATDSASVRHALRHVVMLARSLLLLLAAPASSPPTQS